MKQKKQTVQQYTTTVWEKYNKIMGIHICLGMYVLVSVYECVCMCANQKDICQLVKGNLTAFTFGEWYHCGFVERITFIFNFG